MTTRRLMTPLGRENFIIYHVNLHKNFNFKNLDIEQVSARELLFCPVMARTETLSENVDDLSCISWSNSAQVLQASFNEVKGYFCRL